MSPDFGQARERELRAGLEPLSRTELMARWLALKGIPLPKSTSRELAVLALAHAIQEQETGGLDAETRKKLDVLVRQIVPSGVKPPPLPKKIRAGTRLIREWQGHVHEVLVVQDGFLWQGEKHRSLSVIARQITGTRWNGWLFFGLKKTAAKLAEPTGKIPEPASTRFREERARAKGAGPKWSQSKPAPGAVVEADFHG